MAKAKVMLEDPKMMDKDGDMDCPPEHEISHAADTLQRAEDIKNDPKMMPHVHKHMKKKMHSLKDLMKLGNEKAKEESDAKMNSEME